MSLKNLVGLIGFSLLLGLAPAFAADNVPEIRLYAIDCGSLDIKDVGSLFSDTGEFAGEPGTMVDPCFLIRHPKGTLIWDTGLGDRVADEKTGIDYPAVGIDGDYDVFGDGSVLILKAPGHTPGHQSLEIKLQKNGTVLLSGDLYHLRDSRKLRLVPSVNHERADTLASMDRFERIAKNTKARVVVQHDAEDFRSLPKFPAYLDRTRRWSRKESRTMPHHQNETNWTHAMADIEPGFRLHTVTAGEGKQTVVLLHGFPQTWWEWRHVIPVLADNGFRVVAPDYRGAGHSLPPLGGYDKRTMARDVHRLLRQHLQIDGPVVLVGHDIGLMIAYAFAQAYRQDVSHLVIMDAPLPGTAVFDRLRSNPRLWHFAFHNARDIAEMLVAGRERQYLQAFFYARSFNPSEIDLETYATAYAAPGAMRAGFELYRAFDQDAEDNRMALRENGKLTIPVMAVWGTISNSGRLLEEMMHEVANNVTGFRVPAAAHWIAEENPAEFTAGLLKFLRTAEGS